MKIHDKVKEECAVFGVSVQTDEAVGITYNGLLSLQHRGQEGAGIAVISDNSILCRKGVGLIGDVFSGNQLDKLPNSQMAIGHNRYSTTGSNTIENVQPFVTEYLTGRIATVHNGNLTNAKDIKDRLKSRGVNFNATSDSEVISSLMAYHCMKTEDTVKGIIQGANELLGAFSLLILCSESKLVALRDPTGYRPLCIGQSKDGMANASESCALLSSGFTFVRDVKPGEVIVVENGEITYQSIELTKKNKNDGLCIFEYIYFARPDSCIDNLSVYRARYNMGKILAKEYPISADAVCGVPDSGLDAAAGYSMASGIPLVTGFVKNRYVGRSFIYPTKAQRENAVRLKLNPLKSNIEGKSIVLVDDSIVRGTTCEKIVGVMKSAGAKEVHMRVSSPPVCYTCHFGTDIDNEENLIANRMKIDDMCKKIGADSLGFLSMEGLIRACKDCSLHFCTNCFSGNNNGISQKKNLLE